MTITVSLCVAENGKLLLYFGGQPFGEESYTLTKMGTEWELSGSGHAQMGPMTISIERYRVLTDESFNALEAEAKASLGQISMEVKTRFAGGEAITETPGPDGPEIKRVPVAPGVVVVSENLPVFPFTILARRARLDTTETQQFTGWILGQKSVAMTVQYKGAEPGRCGSRAETLNHFTATLTSLAGQPITADVWIDSDRRIVHMTVPSRNAEVWQAGCEPSGAPTP